MLVSTVVAVAMGVPIGIVAARRPRIGGPLAAAASVVQTVPSLALFGFLLPLPLVGGIGARTALVALILYALLPVIRTTAAGLRSIDPGDPRGRRRDGHDARGSGCCRSSCRSRCRPSLPAFASSAVVGVGTVTIAAAIGAGGLGEYIYRGLSMVDATVILAGAIPVAALAHASSTAAAARRARAVVGVGAARRRAVRAGVAAVVAVLRVGARRRRLARGANASSSARRTSPSR